MMKKVITTFRLVLISIGLISLYSCGTSSTESSSPDNNDFFGERGEISYDVKIISKWTSLSHPTGPSFPSNPHFSPPVSSVHDGTKYFWKRDTTATDGLKSLAETGRTEILKSELLVDLNNGRLNYQTADEFLASGERSYTITASEGYSYLSIASMIAPSPDWFMGISNLNLQDAEGRWYTKIVCDLIGYDAGTEEADVFTMAGSPSNPVQAVHRLQDDTKNKTQNLSEAFAQIVIELGHNDGISVSTGTDTCIITEPVASTTTEPVASTTTEPVASTTTEPVTSTTTEPVASTTTEPVASTTTEPVASTTTEPVASTTTEPAASTAKYTVKISNLWTNLSHPNGPSFPSAPHFSPPVSAVHNSSVHFWQRGSKATSGLESLSETGRTFTFLGEINASNSNDVLSAQASNGFNSPSGSSNFTIEANSSYTLYTMASMIAPSPDWFIGLSNFSLQNAQGKWYKTIECNLIGYDAGTETADSFTFSGSISNPIEDVHRLEDDNGEKTQQLSQPFARITFTLEDGLDDSLVTEDATTINCPS